ncbi:unnamed protein product [Amoebophrya sp. A120]|nr:unnamed protein product [Amoebophrya sp. A120]|eukprot:GSA120T00021245001.1
MSLKPELDRSLQRGLLEEHARHVQLRPGVAAFVVEQWEEQVAKASRSLFRTAALSRDNTNPSNAPGATSSTTMSNPAYSTGKGNGKGQGPADSFCRIVDEMLHCTGDAMLDCMTTMHSEDKAKHLKSLTVAQLVQPRIRKTIPYSDVFSQGGCAFLGNHDALKIGSTGTGKGKGKTAPASETTTSASNSQRLLPTVSDVFEARLVKDAIVNCLVPLSQMKLFASSSSCSTSDTRNRNALGQLLLPRLWSTLPSPMTSLYFAQLELNTTHQVEKMNQDDGTESDKLLPFVFFASIPAIESGRCGQDVMGIIEEFVGSFEFSKVFWSIDAESADEGDQECR